MNVPRVDMIVAMDRDGGIGKDGGMPWKIPGELAYFKSITTATGKTSKQNAVIMGRKTWESLPVRPLPGRMNIVLTRQPTLDLPDGVVVAHQLTNIYQQLAMPVWRDRIDKVFIIGGAELYRSALELGGISRIYITWIDASFQCQVFFPTALLKGYSLISEQPGPAGKTKYWYRIYQKN